MGRGLAGDDLTGAGQAAADKVRALAILTRPAGTAAPANRPVESLARLTHRLGLNDSFAQAAARDDHRPIALSFAGTALWLHPRAAAVHLPALARLTPDPAAAGAAADVLAALELAQPLPPAGPARAIAAQRLCCVAAMLAAALGATRMAWLPARLWSATADLGDAIAAMETEGLPPILHLIGFASDVQAGAPRAQLQSRGLAFFADCELRLDYPAAMPPTEALRRLARLAIHAMLNGAPAPGQTMPGLVDGELLRVAPAGVTTAHAGAATPTIAVVLDQR